MRLLRRAVFLDRDGVINRERPGYVRSVGEFELLPGVGEALAELTRMGFLVIVVTNQQGVNKGIVPIDELERIHRRMREEICLRGGRIDAVYYCPHRVDEGCDCRKPETGLIKRATKDLSIDCPSSWLIGDKDSDIQSGARMGCSTIRIETNGSLLDAVGRIVLFERGKIGEERRQPQGHPGSN